MSQSSIENQIAGAKAYNGLFVPALFGQWASVVADASSARKGQNVLDIACGTGVLTCDMLVRVGREGSVTGVDPNAGMLAVAQELEPNIEWLEGFAESLPFESETFDCVVSQFGFMFFKDKVKAANEVSRVLKSNGSVTIAVWDNIENIPGYSAELSLIESIAGSEAANAVRAPFSMGNAGLLKEILLGAGLQNVEVETIAGNAHFPSIQSMVEAELRGWLPIMGVNLTEEIINRILARAESQLAEFKRDDGSVQFPVFILLARAKK